MKLTAVGCFPLNSSILAESVERILYRSKIFSLDPLFSISSKNKETKSSRPIRQWHRGRRRHRKSHQSKRISPPFVCLVNAAENKQQAIGESASSWRTTSYSVGRYIQLSLFLPCSMLMNRNGFVPSFLYILFHSCCFCSCLIVIRF